MNPTVKYALTYGLLSGLVTCSILIAGIIFGDRLSFLHSVWAGYLIMLLVLLPYCAFRVLEEALGEGRLARIFLVGREPIERV